mmetsp:Transcript_41070/g.41954  ORF Transcript_41070/g.41954 Transcript_41070/m.41954 type:complete len:287 (+) Transcript_41070:43-903(+)
MGFTSVFTLLCAVIAACSYIIYTSDGKFAELQLADAANSQIVSPVYLLALRVTFFLSSLFVATYIYFDKPITITVNLNNNGDTKKLPIQYSERYYAFTLWCWTLLVVYFFLACICSIDFIFMTSYISKELLSFTWVLYELVFSTSYLVSSIVTFVLIPGGKAKGIPVDVFFKNTALFVHNFNIIFILIETLLNNLKFNFWHFPYVMLYGCIYVVFAWRLYWRKGFFIYFFLEYNRDYAVFFHIGLMVVLTIFYIVGCYISWLKESHNVMINTAIIVGSMFVLKFKE